MNKKISPLGCKDCVKVFVDRCGLTGHKIQWNVNAPHHCKEFSIDKRIIHDTSTTTKETK